MSSTPEQQARARMLLKQKYDELVNAGEMHEVAMQVAAKQVIEQMRVEAFYGAAGYGPEDAARLEKKRLLLREAITNPNWKTK